MSESLNIYQKLAKLRAIADVVKKNKKGFGYNYTDITEILAKVTAGMNKYHISLIPMITPGTTCVTQNVTVNTKIAKDGTAFENRSTEMVVKADMIFKWVDEDTEESITVPWAIVGAQNDPSQAFGSGLTYCTRYFLISYFQIGQVETDVDAYRSKQKEAEASEDKAITEGLISEIDKIVREFITTKPDDKDKIVAFLERYVAKGNYKLLKEPILAGKVLSDLKAFIEKGKGSK